MPAFRDPRAHRASQDREVLLGAEGAVGLGLLHASTEMDLRLTPNPCQRSLGHPGGETHLCSASAAARPPSGAWSCPGPPRGDSTSR